MSYSYTGSESLTFTITHARRIAAKVATDLKRMQRFYDSPSDIWIEKFETELIEFLLKGYLETVTYGFQKDGNWIEPTLRYTAKDIGEMSAIDDDPGRIQPGANVIGAHFNSYLTYSSKWHELSQAEKDNFDKILPFQRAGAPEPGIMGYLSSDKTYSSGGKALDRSTVKSF